MHPRAPPGPGKGLGRSGCRATEEGAVVTRFRFDIAKVRARG
ncbi:MAG: hypothetical protein AB7N76_09055 [Planctomycetota bacterium]